MYLEIGLIIIGIAVLLLVLFCIPVLLKLGQAVNDINITLQTLNERLPLILKNMEEISTNINQSTTAINCEVQRVAFTAQRLHTVMNDVVVGIEAFSPLALKYHVFRKATWIIPVIKGVNAFIRVLSGKEKV
ncbi:MAG: putative rane protein [Deltaproteobacteria bacterium]|nr:putative rane protein [Deltaproteobacteria bacterium]